MFKSLKQLSNLLSKFNKSFEILLIFTELLFNEISKILKELSTIFTKFLKLFERSIKLLFKLLKLLSIALDKSFNDCFNKLNEVSTIVL